MASANEMRHCAWLAGMGLVRPPTWCSHVPRGQCGATALSLGDSRFIPCVLAAKNGSRCVVSVWPDGIRCAEAQETNPAGLSRRWQPASPRASQSTPMVLHVRTPRAAAPVLQALLEGSLHTQGIGPDSFVEYRVMGGRHVNGAEARRCLAGRAVAFVGDSRLRYLYASFVRLLGDTQDPAQPKYRACPYSNTPHRVTRECTLWYSECGSFQCHELDAVTYSASSSQTRVSYIFNNFASTARHAEATLQAQARHFGRPFDMLVANVGAWGVMAAKGLAQKHNVTMPVAADSCSVAVDRWSPQELSHCAGAKESAADRLRFYRTLASSTATADGGDAPLAIAVGYPECTCGKAHLRLCVNKVVFNASVRATLREAGWLTYHPARPTGSHWLERQGSYGRAWSAGLLPKSALATAEAKWDQCQSLHTFDTLADLEVQLLLNAVCKVAP